MHFENKGKGSGCLCEGFSSGAWNRVRRDRRLAVLRRGLSAWFGRDRDEAVFRSCAECGEGEGTGKRILNPVTEVYLKNDATMEMDSVQIKGVDSTVRVTKGVLEENSNFIVSEKILTHGNQFAKTAFEVELNGENTSTKVTSRSVATENSEQHLISDVIGNSECFGHVE